MRAPALIEARGLSLRLGQRCLVAHLDLTVHAGECWVLLGPNGAGKTCLLEALVGLRKPAAGRIRYPGLPESGLGGRAAARHRAYLPQHVEHGLPLSVYQLVLAARHPHRDRHGQAWESEEDRREVAEALAALDLLPRARQALATLSGGERQRVALAAVLAQQTPLWVLDEPLNHLDPRHQRLWLGTLRERCALHAGQAGHGAVCSLHDLDLAQRIASHAILLDGHGGAVAGPAPEVLTPDRLGAVFGVAVRAFELDGQRRLLVDTLP